MADSVLQIREGGGGGHPDPEISGWGDGLKKKFSALRASVWSKNKWGPGPPPLDPPLRGVIIFLKGSNNSRFFQSINFNLCRDNAA